MDRAIGGESVGHLAHGGEGLDALIGLFTGRRRPWIPDPQVSDAQAIRFQHLDIADAEDLGLLSELTFLLVVRHGVGRSEWEDERIRMIQEELVRRNAASEPLRFAEDRHLQPRLAMKPLRRVATVDDLLAGQVPT